MAPIIKTTLTLLSVSASLINAHAVHQPTHHGKHLKQIKRTLFEDLGKRDQQFAPYGYDRCGVPRKSPYVRKPGASPSASAKWKPCPTDQSVEQKALADPAVPTHSDEDESDDAAGLAPQTPTGGASSSSSAASSNDDQGVWTGPTGKVAAKAAPASTSSKSEEWSASEYTTQFMGMTTAYTVDSPAPSSSASSSSESVWSAPPAKVAQKAPAQNNNNNNGNGNDNNNKDNNNAGSSSSSSQWVEPAPSSSSSVAPAPSPYVPPASGSGAGKMGLAWDWRNPNGVLNQWQCKFLYTWSAWPPADALPSGCEFYPMYWGPGKAGDIAAAMAAGRITPGMTILGYNEPDQPGQANLGVWDAIGSYKAQLTPLVAQGYKITTPATTSDENGFQWLKQFIDGCAGTCGFQYVAFHYYGNNAQDFISYCERVKGITDLPIIVSEFASETFGWGADLSLDETRAYMTTVQAYLNNEPRIIGYAAFGTVMEYAANGVNSNALMLDGAGNKNGLGQLYQSNA